MSFNEDENDNSIAARRPRRNIRLSQKAVDIVGTGEGFPGIASPDTHLQADYFSAPIATTAPTSAMVAMSRRTSPIKTDNLKAERYRLGIFSPEKFAIYHWEYPRPKSFLNLSESRRAWKRRTDEQEAANDIDDGSDDWECFSDTSGNHCVARTFVQRAKRVFRSGRSWEEFEEQERSINSEVATASATTSQHQLNNAFRLEVFDMLKRRLREEIWLEPYTDPPGLVRLPLPRKDSVMPSVNGPGGRRLLPGSGRIMEPLPQEAERGIAAWTFNRVGEWEPRYADEKKVSSGVEHFMQYWRAEEKTGFTSVPRRRIDAGQRNARIGNIGINGRINMSAIEEVARGEPDFETSDDGDG